jgi:dolichyl-phosphate beta-glucosyltransferase
MAQVSGAGAQLSLIVPLYNEEHRVGRTAPALARFTRGLAPGSELVFVDDGSSDGTVDIVQGLVHELEGRLRLIRRPHEGKGAAVMAGIKSARCEYVGFCDVDLATPLEDIAHLLQVSRQKGALTIGSRALQDSNILVHEHASRELLGRAYNLVLRSTLTPGIYDTQCGAKVAPREVWGAIVQHCREPGFAWDVEVIATAMTLGAGVLEVPVTWAHDAGTRVRVLRDGTRMLTSLVGINRRVRALSRSLRTTVVKEDGLVVLAEKSPIVE